MNDRIYLAKRALATLEGDARSRVAIAARMLSIIQASELQINQFERIKNIISDATKFPEVRDSTGNVLSDKFEQTAKNTKNKTAVTTAKKIFDL